MTAPLTLQPAAAVVGSHCWVERRLFELLGGWSAATPTAAATLALDRHAQHAAWRAAQWYDRLPVLAGVDREALVTAARPWTALAGPAFSAAVDPDAAVDTDASSGGEASAVQAGVGRLAVAYRVLLPRLAVAYSRQAAATSPVADGPVIRTLGRLRPDIVADWADGEQVLQDLLGAPGAVDAAAAAVAAAERLLVG